MSYNFQGVPSKTIPQGSTISYSAGFLDGSAISGDWACHIQVRERSTRSLTTVDRQVVDKNVEGTRFLTTVTAAETSALKPGSYVVGMEMYNTVTGEVIEKIELLEVTEQWVIRS